MNIAPDIQDLIDQRDALLDIVYEYRFDTAACDFARANVERWDQRHPEGYIAWEILNGGEL